MAEISQSHAYIQTTYNYHKIDSRQLIEHTDTFISVCIYSKKKQYSDLLRDSFQGFSLFAINVMRAILTHRSLCNFRIEVICQPTTSHGCYNQ